MKDQAGKSQRSTCINIPSKDELDATQVGIAVYLYTVHNPNHVIGPSHDRPLTFTLNKEKVIPFHKYAATG